MASAVAPDILGSLFAIFKSFDHPCVLLGQAAHRWMGSGGCVDLAMDLLVRDEQLDLIATAFAQSGHWNPFDAQSELDDDEKQKRRQRVLIGAEIDHEDSVDSAENEQFLTYCCDADRVLRLGRNQSWCFTHIRLWSERTFRLKVDGPSWINVPALYHGRPIVVQADFHPAADRTDGWFFGPSLMSQYDTQIYTAGEAGDNNLYIPSIPLYLDALVFHSTHGTESKNSLAEMSGWQIKNLIRYLYLELPAPRAHILSQLESATKDYLEKILLRYKRKPVLVVTSEKKIVYVEVHRPESYPVGTTTRALLDRAKSLDEGK